MAKNELELLIKRLEKLQIAEDRAYDADGLFPGKSYTDAKIALQIKINRIDPLALDKWWNAYKAARP
jgi:hypothetical protein